MTEPLLRCEGLQLHRGGKPVLHQIDLEVLPGQVIGLIGRNGAGKSSLLEALLGFHHLSAGTVTAWGMPVRQLPAEHKRRIGLVTQRDELLEGLTGEQQLRLIASFYPDWDRALVDRLSASWALPLQRRISTWSLGQRQRLAIVLALAAGPDLLVLDEPVASLDPLARAQFLLEMRTLIADQGRAVIISSHIVSDLEAMVNQVWLLDQGVLRWSGAISEIGELIGPGADAPASLEQVFRSVIR